MERKEREGCPSVGAMCEKQQRRDALVQAEKRVDRRAREGTNGGDGRKGQLFALCVGVFRAPNGRIFSFFFHRSSLEKEGLALWLGSVWSDCVSLCKHRPS